MDRLDAAEVVTSGVVGFAWYALPDVVRSRRARGWLKAALLVPVGLIGVAEAVLDTGSLGLADDDGPRAGRVAVALGVGGLVLAAGAAGILTGERALYRLGERLAARGVSHPHTRIGVAAGLAAAGISTAMSASAGRRT